MTNNKEETIKKLSKKLRLSPELSFVIEKKYAETRDIAKLSGKRPNTIIAAITYHYCREHKEKRNQETIADELGITQVSLRNVLRNIYEVKELDDWLRRT